MNRLVLRIFTPGIRGEMELSQRAVNDRPLAIAFETDPFHSAKDRRQMTVSIIGFWRVPAHQQWSLLRERHLYLPVVEGASILLSACAPVVGLIGHSHVLGSCRGVLQSQAMTGDENVMLAIGTLLYSGPGFAHRKTCNGGLQDTRVTEQRDAMIMPMRQSIVIVNDFSEPGR